MERENTNSTSPGFELAPSEARTTPLQCCHFVYLRERMEVHSSRRRQKVPRKSTLQRSYLENIKEHFDTNGNNNRKNKNIGQIMRHGQIFYNNVGQILNIFGH